MKVIKDQIKDTESEMRTCQYKLDRMKKRIPFAILVGIAFVLLVPFVPGRRGRRPSIETWGYTNAVIFASVVFVFMYVISYVMKKSELEKKLRELKLKKHLLEKRLKNN